MLITHTDLPRGLRVNGITSCTLVPGLSVRDFLLNASVPVNLAGRFDITALSLFITTSPGDWNVIDSTLRSSPQSLGFDTNLTKWLCHLVSAAFV